MSTSPTSSPFIRAAVSAIQRLYPPQLADKSFDNTGLLLEAPFDRSKHDRLKNEVLLTIDLTTAVADEAIKRGSGLVLAYRESLESLL